MVLGTGSVVRVGFWHGSGLGTRGRDHCPGATAGWGDRSLGGPAVASAQRRGRAGRGQPPVRAGNPGLAGAAGGGAVGEVGGEVGEGEAGGVGGHGDEAGGG
jgi:hypothetical protein